MLTRAGCQAPTKVTLSLPSTGQERESKKKSDLRDKGRERSFNSPHRAKQTQFEEISLLSALVQLVIQWAMKQHFKNTFPPLIPFLKGTATTGVLSLSLLGSAWAVEAQGRFAGASPAAPLLPQLCHTNPVQTLSLQVRHWQWCSSVAGTWLLHRADFGELLITVQTSCTHLPLKYWFVRLVPPRTWVAWKCYELLCQRSQRIQGIY